MEKVKKVIIDCDPGIDDALALILALNSTELDIKGISIVSGNVEAEQGAKNALKVLKLMNRLDIPVYIGEKVPLVRKLITAQDTHGKDGLGETFIDDVTEVTYKYGAVDFILDTIKKEERLSIIALGPLTNVAKCLEKDMKVFNKLEEIVCMGGTYKVHGNCSPVAEFNFWVDPHAAKYVFDNIKLPFYMVGLDVTRECVLTPNYRELINQFRTSLSKFIVDITQFYVDFHWKQEKTLGCVINDPLAVAYFIDRSICESFSSYVDIVIDGIAMGQSIVDIENFYGRKHNCVVLSRVDSTKFMKFFLKRIFAENKFYIDKILDDKKYGY